MAKTKNFIAEAYGEARKFFSFLEDPKYFPMIALALLVYIFFGPQLLPIYVIEFLNSGLVRMVVLVIVAVLLAGSPSLACLFLVAFIVTVLAARTTVFDYFEDMKKEAKEEAKKEMKGENFEDAPKSEEKPTEEEEDPNAAMPMENNEKMPTMDMNETEMVEEETTMVEENFANRRPVQYQAGLVNAGDFNYTSSCQASCGGAGLPTQGKSVDGPCNAVAAFTPELNAQGMNCPMGYTGPVAGANF